MKSNDNYKANPIRGLVLIIIVGILLFFTVNRSITNSSIIMYFFSSSSKSIISYAKSIKLTPTITPQIIFKWKPFPSVSPTVPSTALSHPNLIPSIAPASEKMMVSAAVNENPSNNSALITITLVDEDNHPLPNAVGTIHINNEGYSLPLTNQEGMTSITIPIKIGSDLTVTENYAGLIVSDTLLISQ